jgi:isopenicillin N synthase-like dioxygenase
MILRSQNVTGLQIQTKDLKWKYIPPVNGGIICKTGDLMQFWSAGYLRSKVHGVVKPPEDQVHQDRLGLFYFMRPGDGMDISPANTPLLVRMGLVKEGGLVSLDKKRATCLQHSDQVA